VSERFADGVARTLLRGEVAEDEMVYLQRLVEQRRGVHARACGSRSRALDDQHGLARR
jgi:hypothetical protein